MKGSQRRTTPFFRTGLQYLYLLFYARAVLGEFTSQPRWGQAVAVVNNLLFISGGKTDQYGSYSYTSAPTTNDLFTLDLSESFDPSSPPWQYISGSQNTSTIQGQELAWHTLAAYNTSQLLLFGGDGGPNSPIVLPSQSNSAQLLDVSSSIGPQWISESEGWAGEPSRRIHHTTASVGGKIYLIGGEKDDGSSLGYSDHYVFDPSSPSFTQLPTDNGPPDIYGHGSIVLSDGRLLVFGGYSQSESNLIPFTTIWSMDTTQSSLSWSSESVSSDSVPSGRRAFAYTWLEGNKVLIHGGSDAEFQTSYSDGWILDTTTSPMTWSNVSVLTELGARRDHFAVQVGSQVLFVFGYGTNAGASVAISIFDYDKDSFTSSFSPQSGPSLTTIPVPSGTSGSSPGGSNGSGSGGTAGSNPTGGPHGTGTAGSGDPSSPSGTGSNGGGGDGSGNSGGGDGDEHNAAVIAVASIFGVLAVALAAGLLVVFLIRRRRTRQQFHLIHNDDDHVGPSASAPWELAGVAILPWFRTRRALARGEKTRVADKKEGWTVLGLGRPRKRIDMLANEDASELGMGRRARRFGSGSSRSWYSVHDGASGHERYGSGNSSRPSIGRLFSGSLGSLKNIGAGVKRVISGGTARGHGRQWTDVSLPLDAFDAYEDSEGLLLHDKSNLYGPDRFSAEEDIALAARPRGGRNESSTVSKYSDPFQDRNEGEVLFDASVHTTERNSLDGSGPSSGIGHEQLDANPRSSQSTLSRSSIVPQLPPLVTTASKSTSNDPSSSSLLDGSNGGHTLSNSSHQAALSITSSSRPRTTSIIGSTGAPSSPVKRSDSWWTRFRRTSLRESMQDQMKPSAAKMDLDFRDPNPPPGRLGAIKEASGGSAGAPESPESSQRGRPGHGKKHSGSARIYSTSGHEQSTTSLKTSRTADSAALERFAGRVDVAQREATGTSIDYSPSFVESTGQSHERSGTWSSAGNEGGRPSSPPSPDRSQDIADGTAFIDNDRDEPRLVVQSPTTLTSNLPQDFIGSSIRPVSQPPSGPASPSAVPIGKSPVSPGTVAARIADYERRMSLEISAPALPVSPRAARSRESAQSNESKPPAKRKNSNVKYGLVHRPELFVANPDRHSISGSSDV